jgi:3-isopropylmalate/(R)-2-methylmalate dehydratase small subunit
VLPIDAVRELWRPLKEKPGAQITVDLVGQTVIAPDGARFEFEIDATRKERLLKGLDDVGVTLEHLPQIEAFEAAYRQRMPWRASRI